jgi:hypothetical protein
MYVPLVRTSSVSYRALNYVRIIFLDKTSSHAMHTLSCLSPEFLYLRTKLPAGHGLKASQVAANLLASKVKRAYS